MRIEALGQANDTVMEQGSDRDRDLWGRMGGSERFAHLVSTRRRMSLAVINFWCNNFGGSTWEYALSDR